MGNPILDPNTPLSTSVWNSKYSGICWNQSTLFETYLPISQSSNTAGQMNGKSFKDQYKRPLLRVIDGFKVLALYVFLFALNLIGYDFFNFESCINSSFLSTPQEIIKPINVIRSNQVFLMLCIRCCKKHSLPLSKRAMPHEWMSSKVHWS